jgi:large subunit ribosomal protein L35
VEGVRDQDPAREPLNGPRSGDKGETMPKMKTNKAAAKRFKITATGRVRRPKGGANHFMGNKRPNRLRRLRKNDMVHSAMEGRVLQLFPYALK